MTNAHPEAGHSFDVAYRDAEDMYGRSYQELRDYFRGRVARGAVLDLGCGQGRDALFLAMLGCQVTAVDSSEVGVEQMLKKARAQNLQVDGIVGDVLDVKIDNKFDVVLFDMILHSFDESQRAELLKKYSENLMQEGIMCIVFPDDMSTGDFMGMLSPSVQKWELRDEIVIKDVPKLKGEEPDFKFVMIAAQRLS